ncbi:MAG: histidinol-phosphatase HisJ family protein [Coriobacteriia bacterium]
MIDLHVHTWRCRHADGTPDQYVAAAVERGVSVLAFTEHLPLPAALVQRVPGAAGYAMPAEEFAEHVAEVARAAALGRELGVEVLLGAEIDAVPQARDHAAVLVAQHPFDLVSGSVHLIDDWAFDDPAHRARYAQWRTAELWERYFHDLAEAARSGLADVMAHPDLIKKFCGAPENSVTHLFESAAEAFAEAGVAVEVNTAGLRKPCREIYPSLELLSAMRRRGVPATIGSDAHCPGDVGADGSLAVALLEQAGYRSVVVFRARVPEEVGLHEL